MTTAATTADLAEYYAQLVTCTRDGDHVLSVREAFIQQWANSEIHGWLCRPCADELRAEKALATTCPEWCNSCGGYDVEDGSVDHRHVWVLQSVGKVITVYEVRADHGVVHERGATFENTGDLTVSDLYLVARCAAEAAEMMTKYNLTPIGVGE